MAPLTPDTILSLFAVTTHQILGLSWKTQRFLAARIHSDNSPDSDILQPYHTPDKAHDTLDIYLLQSERHEMLEITPC